MPHLRRTTPRAALLLVAAVALLAGCSAEDTPSDGPTTVVTVPEPTQGQPAPEPSSATLTASPDVDQTAELLTALDEIVPGVSADPEAAVDRARTVCLDIAAGKEATILAANVGQQFTGADGNAITDDQSARIVTTVQTTFCHE